MKGGCKAAASLPLLMFVVSAVLPVSAQTQVDPATADAMVAMRPTIGMVRDMLESTARQMAVADQSKDIEKMFEEMDGETGRSGKSKPAPVNSTIRTLDCAALAARVKQVDAAIEAKFVEVEASEKVVDAQIKASSAAAASVMATTSQMCNHGGLVGCLAALAISNKASAGLSASASRNATAVNDLDALRKGFDPLLRERTTAIYYAERNACK